MSDNFWGGALDDMRGIVSDANSFFKHSIGSAVAKGIAGGATPQNNINKLFEAERLSKLNNVNDNHTPGQFGYAPARDLDVKNESKAVNYENIEGAWLTRMRKFSQIDTEIAAGKINEGTPR